MQAAHAVNRFSKKFWDYFDLPSKCVGAKKVIRATDAKEVGVENPSEETFCRPDQRNWCPDNLPEVGRFVNRRIFHNLFTDRFPVTFAPASLYFPALTGGPLRLVVRTPAFHAGDTGSSPVGVATFCGYFCKKPPVLDVFSLSTPRLRN